MKKLFALLLAGLMVFSLAGCIVINQDQTSTTEDASKTEAPTVEPTPAVPETKATDAPETDAPETDEPEPETAESGKILPWANEPQASDDMRYPYEWLGGLYQASGSFDGDEMSVEILFYENGLFSSEEHYEGYNDGKLGSYIIIGDTIYLHVLLRTGGGVGANVVSEDYIMGINNNGTLMSGDFLGTPGMLELHKCSEADRTAFENENGFEKVLQGNPLINQFFEDHPEGIKLLLP